MWNETTIPGDLSYNGRLLSGRRPLFLCMGLTVAFLMTAAIHSPAATLTALQALIGIAAMRVVLPANVIWSEGVRLSIDAAGVTLTRSGGKTHFAQWHMFDDARIRPLNPFREKTAGASSWKVTLMNARKPAISSFINADADQVLFMFPLEFAFDATDEEARALHGALTAMIEIDPQE